MDPELSTKVEQQAKNLARHSWEYGVVFDALLETHNPELSVYAPFLHCISTSIIDSDNVPALNYVKPFIRTNQDTLIDGNGSAGDPASLGIPALLLGATETRYLDAACRQKHVVLEKTPRWENGAISHRTQRAELWSDSVYMVAPFLAYYARIEKDKMLLNEAAQQCILYKDVLQSSSGLWMHIISHNSSDRGIWSTGNGWAAVGMSRVLAVLKSCNIDEQDHPDLGSWVEVLGESIMAILIGAAEASRDEGGLLRNYIGDESWFGEVAGTAGIATAVFRMAILSPEKVSTAIIAWASACRDAVYRHISRSDGLASPVVNPMNTQDRKPGMGSAEGQAFVLLLEAAHRDWKKSKSNHSL